jgi:hypothetical protein
MPKYRKVYRINNTRSSANKLGDFLSDIFKQHANVFIMGSGNLNLVVGRMQLPDIIKKQQVLVIK